MASSASERGFESVLALTVPLQTRDIYSLMVLDACHVFHPSKGEFYLQQSGNHILTSQEVMNLVRGIINFSRESNGGESDYRELLDEVGKKCLSIFGQGGVDIEFMEKVFCDEVEFFKGVINKNRQRDPDLFSESLIAEVLKGKEAIADRVRKKRQKSHRNLMAIREITSSVERIKSDFLCVRVELFIETKSAHREQLYLLESYKKEFITEAAKSAVFCGCLRYFWFLEWNEIIGFKLHFYFLCDPFVVGSIDAITHDIGGFWVDHITRGVGDYIACHHLPDELRHRWEGTGIITGDESAYWGAVRYMCHRQIYTDIPFSAGINRFGSGGFMWKKGNSGYGKAALPVSRSREVLPMWATLQRDENEIAVRLGSDINNYEPVFWLPERLNNGCMLISGQSGSGKSNSLQQVVSQLHESSVPVLVLDPHDALGGLGFRTIIFSGGKAGSLGVNPLRVHPDPTGRVGLDDQIGEIHQVLTRLMGGLGRRQSAALLQGIREAFDRAGWKEGKEVAGLFMPTLGDVIKIMQAWVDDPHHQKQRAVLESCISIVQHAFSHPVFNRADEFDVIKDLREGLRIDLGALPNNVRFIVVETLIRQIFHHFSSGDNADVSSNERKRFRLFIVMDEAKRLMIPEGKGKISGSIINVLVSEGRKYGLALVAATQCAAHFGEELWINAASRLVHQTSDQRDAKFLARQLNVPQVMVTSLAGQGSAIFSDGYAAPVAVYMHRFGRSKGMLGLASDGRI